MGAEEWSVSKKGGGGGGDGGFGVERDVFNACFILCFLEGGGGEMGIMHVYSDLSTHFSSLISDIPFKYPLTDTERGEREGGGWVGGGENGGWRPYSAHFCLLPTADGGRRSPRVSPPPSPLMDEVKRASSSSSASTVLIISSRLRAPDIYRLCSKS